MSLRRRENEWDSSVSLSTSFFLFSLSACVKNTLWLVVVGFQVEEGGDEGGRKPHDDSLQLFFFFLCVFLRVKRKREKKWRLRPRSKAGLNLVQSIFSTASLCEGNQKPIGVIPYIVHECCWLFRCSQRKWMKPNIHHKPEASSSGETLETGTHFSSRLLLYPPLFFLNADDHDTVPVVHLYNLYKNV